MIPLGVPVQLNLPTPWLWYAFFHICWVVHDGQIRVSNGFAPLARLASPRIPLECHPRKGKSLENMVHESVLDRDFQGRTIWTAIPGKLGSRDSRAPDAAPRSSSRAGERDPGQRVRAHLISCVSLKLSILPKKNRRKKEISTAGPQENQVRTSADGSCRGSFIFLTFPIYLCAGVTLMTMRF